MTIDERQVYAQELMAKCLDVLKKKGTDYSGKMEAYKNFKDTAQRLGLTKYQVWLTFFDKHVNSIANSVKADPNSPHVESEPLEGRIIDVINYAIILGGMLKEDEGKVNEDIPF